ncbi:16S/23S rRNA (cytidine-2'-O)-methyltransferase TlyA [Variovorax sp. PBS-H4]|uniref:TlyA family RNA methyltransferase n=1 Tax=Variovorax sp. PBS-H4 TaxID=434008 RepID=UPI0013196D1F|nr:TlyA family RNA methyltransferase [Variovorax sp. PBS-H4]VTU40601.1 16S/23S rRNA (cytidine-2'-O)-methyltransferase TlyA [Variovorax sp. PBS-H4]
MRADQLLVERGLAASRSQAARLIAGGLRWRDGACWRTVGKNGEDLPKDAELELLDPAEARYVSRGGLKLEGALAAAGIEVRGRRCLDVGQSTGGFTDCLLQQGAAHVVGVDVGHGQLHPRLREDARVTAVEGVNARVLDASAWDAAAPAAPQFDLIVGDLSFISLTLVLPALVPLLAATGELLMLVKPQFELQPGQVGKGGIVRDASLYPVVEQRLRAACDALGLQVRGWFDSPIAGGDGNREFFIHAAFASGPPGAGRAPSVEL